MPFCAACAQLLLQDQQAASQQVLEERGRLQEEVAALRGQLAAVEASATAASSHTDDQLVALSAQLAESQQAAEVLQVRGGE